MLNSVKYKVKELSHTRTRTRGDGNNPRRIWEYQDKVVAFGFIFTH